MNEGKGGGCLLLKMIEIGFVFVLYSVCPGPLVSYGVDFVLETRGTSPLFFIRSGILGLSRIVTWHGAALVTT